MNQAVCAASRSQGELAQLRATIESLQAQLEDAQQTLRAIREGAIDALVIDTPQGPRVFTFQGGDHLYRALIEQMREGAVTLTPQGVIYYGNQRFAEMLKLPLEQLLGGDIEDFVAAADRPLLAAMLAKQLDRAELLLVAGDATEVPVLVSAIALQAEGPDAISLVMTDLTERKRHEQEIHQLNAELEQRVHQRTVQLEVANRELEAEIAVRKQAEDEMRRARIAAETANAAKSRFLANVSHELRTPMNAILGMMQLASQKTVEPTARDFLKTAKESADLLLTLLNDLLDSAKIEAGKLELCMTPFSLRSLLDQTTRVLALRASEQGLAFSIHMSQDLPQVVIGDRMRLQQILLNLAGNAIKFTERGHVEIRVSARLQNDAACLEFTVRDTGIGISPADLEQIFQPFAQADSSITRRFGGTGLGLSICRNLVSLMGGHLWAESEVGHGSTFCFTVQLPVSKELSDESAAPAGPTGTGVPLRILLAEDNPANQKFATYVLQERGHRVDVAGDGLEAILLHENNAYDVILMDLQMPRMGGLEATAMIRQAANGRSRIPIIAMTAHAMKEDQDGCLAAGMDGYLAKPVDGQRMIDLVESLARGLPPRT